MPRALLIQLARLGDLVQTLPVITALHSRFPEQPLDLLCPTPLVTLGKYFPGISDVYPWEGQLWKPDHIRTEKSLKAQFMTINQAWKDQGYPSYRLAYNLNNHPRSILVAHLLAERIIGPGSWGPMNPQLSPWGNYLRTVACFRGRNRIHLSDAFCGLCQVMPPAEVPRIMHAGAALPSGLEGLGNSSAETVIGLVLGAGDRERRIPALVWASLIHECVEALPDVRILLIGGNGETEVALAVENVLSLSCLNRVNNICGRTSLSQLIRVFNECRWVIGSDTGPLHLGALCGARAIGWYFARARVHETGPYGAGHFVWQYNQGAVRNSVERVEYSIPFERPRTWPVKETVQLLSDVPGGAWTDAWTLWTSQYDFMGTFYHHDEHPDAAEDARREVWEKLSPALFSRVS